MLKRDEGLSAIYVPLAGKDPLSRVPRDFELLKNRPFPQPFDARRPSSRRRPRCVVTIPSEAVAGWQLEVCHGTRSYTGLSLVGKHKIKNKNVLNYDEQ